MRQPMDRFDAIALVLSATMILSDVMLARALSMIAVILCAIAQATRAVQMRERRRQELMKLVEADFGGFLARAYSPEPQAVVKH